MRQGRENVTAWISSFFGNEIVSTLHQHTSRLKLMEAVQCSNKKKMTTMELLQNMCQQALQVHGCNMSCEISLVQIVYQDTLSQILEEAKTLEDFERVQALHSQMQSVAADAEETARLVKNSHMVAERLFFDAAHLVHSTRALQLLREILICSNHTIPPLERIPVNLPMQISARFFEEEMTILFIGALKMHVEHMRLHTEQQQSFLASVKTFPESYTEALQQFEQIFAKLKQHRGLVQQIYRVQEQYAAMELEMEHVRNHDGANV